MVDTSRSVRLISLWQPWASAIVTPHPFRGFDSMWGIKRYETRHWRTPIMERVLIHASKRWDKVCKEAFNSWPFNNYHECLTDGKSLPFGAIVGSVEIVSCIRSEDWRGGLFINGIVSWQEEKAMGNYDDGRYAWELRNPIRFKDPIPFKGCQTPFVKFPWTGLPEDYQKGFIGQQIKL